MRVPGLLAACALCATFRSHSSPVGVSARFVDPTTFQSASGKVVCEVDPGTKFGADGATYRVTKNGMELWSGKQEFTLYEAAVSEDGTVCGFAYTEGWLGIYPKQTARPKVENFVLADIDRRKLGSLIVAAIDPTGRLLFKKTFDRSIRADDPNTAPSIPWPEASLVKLDSAKNEFSMLMHGRSDKAKFYEICRFNLSSGEELDATNETADWRNWRDVHHVDIDRRTMIGIVRC